jgi:hypothetical protein
MDFYLFFTVFSRDGSMYLFVLILVAFFNNSYFSLFAKP